MVKRFEDLIAWQKGQDFSSQIYLHFRDIKDYAFKDQICRASVSISNNIAEGFERRSNKEFKNFLFIAKGSCGEVRSMLALALDLGYISQSDYVKYYDQAIEISKMLSGLIKTL